MRVVLDTNVLISAIFFSGPQSRIVSAWVEEEFELAVSTKILEEYRAVDPTLVRSRACSPQEHVSIWVTITLGTRPCTPDRARATPRRPGEDASWPHAAQSQRSNWLATGFHPSTALPPDRATSPRRRAYGFVQFAGVIGGVQKTPPSVMVWFPPFSVAKISNS